MVTLYNSTPVQLSESEPLQLDPEVLKEQITYIRTWKTRLYQARIDKKGVWDECWALYRGVEDWSNKDEWQSKIVLPKSFSAVEQATSYIKRLLGSNKDPWALEAVNTDNPEDILRAAKNTKLTKFFLEEADFLEHFGEGLKNSFIMGLGVWKLWWGYKPRKKLQTQVVPNQEGGYDKQTVLSDIDEGHLFIRAVDPYNFFWLPGSRLNKWAGTIEEIEVPKWELLKMAEQGIFDRKLVEDLQPMRINPAQEQPYLRFQERRGLTASPADGGIKLTEYWGPIMDKDRVIEPYGQMIIANDSVLLKSTKGPYWHGKSPYVGFSPITLPFRTEGMGLIEMVRAIHRALNNITNLSVDTQMYRLLPIFEMTPDVYENPEDFDTGLTPGKIFRRSMTYMGQPGIIPVRFDDISQGSLAVASQLDRSHQEGSMVSEIQQGIPRFRGAQTAAEIETKSEFQQGLFGNMASEIERSAIKPLVEMASDLIFQFLSTNSDERVASILGVDAALLAGLTQEDLVEMVAGNYKIKVSGITEQLEKAEMLQNLVQLMNIIGQNPESWAPYINQEELLKRILEAFTPMVRDIDKIIAPPEMQEAKMAMLQESEKNGQMQQLLSTLLQHSQVMQAQQHQQQIAEGQLEMQRAAQQTQDLTTLNAMMQPPTPKGGEE